MTSLAHFSASEAEILISLPYRIGVFISHADDAEGERDDRREMAALKSCIRAVVDQHRDRPFAAEVMKETLRLEFEWPRWAEKAFAVHGDAEKAVSLLKSKAGESTARSYAASVMEIAAAVARAHGEFFSGPEDEQDQSALTAFFSRIIGELSVFTPEDAGHPMNVSASENEALTRLSAALKV